MQEWVEEKNSQKFSQKFRSKTVLLEKDHRFLREMALNKSLRFLKNGMQSILLQTTTHHSYSEYNLIYFGRMKDTWESLISLALSYLFSEHYL